MSCYDMIQIVCPYCKKFVISQTKIFGNNTLQTFGVGDYLDADEFEGIYELKEKCDCGRMVDTTKEQVFDLKSGYTMLR